MYLVYNKTRGGLNMDNRNKLTFVGLTLENHPLFDEKISFFVNSDQKVFADKADQLIHLIGSIWINKLIALVGKNATGKTTILKLIIGTLSLLLEDESISHTKLNDVLMGNSPIKINTFFYGSDKLIYRDELILKRDTNKKWIIDSEKIYRKKATLRLTKKSLLEFDDKQIIYDRKDIDGVAASVLATDDSIFRIIRKANNYKAQSIVDTLIFTNINALFYPYGSQNIPSEILEYLDPTIDYLKIDNVEVDSNNRTAFYRLKFKHSNEEITDTNFATIENYLSSGTAKGVTLYGNILYALRTGGIIFVDELENHFNHAIVRTFIEYFVNNRINKNNATIIFSTHYSELLDDFERGDEIYVTKRDNSIHLQRYSSAKIRSELNKGEVFDSDYLGGTAPEYDAYLKLRKATERAIQDE